MPPTRVGTGTFLFTVALLLCLQDDLVIDSMKYSVKVVRRGPILFNVSLNNSNVDVLARKLGDGGFLLQVGSMARCLAITDGCHA